MDSLNPQQHAAVTDIDRPLLVLAGAGSGKTRVITEKIAYLIRHGLPARHIAAVTFTNKAAREMKSRVGRLVAEKDLRGLTVSTFHALGLDILRREHGALGFKKNLSIFDEGDRLLLLKELVKHGDFGATEEVEGHAAQLGVWKNRFITPERAAEMGAPAAALYAAYTRQLKSYNAVDFDDLIMLPVRLFLDHPAVLEKWQNRIRYLLVDEYQDTNQTQYELVKLLVGRIGRMTVVGDDDQSVYAWRGAQPENLLALQHDFPRLRVIKLEQNYRSFGRILKAANQLIAHNPHVFEKRLWSALGQGDPIRVLSHRDDLAESRQVVSDLIHHKFRHGTRFEDYAILYRGNHQSRPFERALREAGVPYFISGGPSFFGYAEVKDILAYLRLLVNPDDDAAFLRVVNVPRREIGPTTLEKLGEYAQRRHHGLFACCQELGLEHALPEAAVTRLRQFCGRIRTAAEQARGDQPFAAVEAFIASLRYDVWLKENSPSDDAARRRMGRVEELLDWLKRLATAGEQRLDLAGVVAKVLLLDVLERGQEEASGDRVNLMTLHASKGLEFPYVYLIGLEENILPHQSSIEDGNIEEERRLAYVGITRAQRELTLSYCKFRKRRAETVDSEPSRFLSELPEEDLEWCERKALDPEVRKERGQASLAQMRSLLNQD